MSIRFKENKKIYNFQVALEAVRGPQFHHCITDMSNVGSHDDYLVFDLVKEFLQNAGQSQMIAQCEQSENELGQLAAQQSLLIHNCLDMLYQYSKICSLYPMSHIAQHRSVVYSIFANKLLATGTVEACHEVLQQLDAFFAPVASNDPRLQRTVAFSYQVSRK